MKLYHDLMEKFWEECEDSEEYVELAHEHSIEHKEYAMHFLKKAEQECMHAEELLQDIVKLWELKKAKGEHENEKNKHAYSHYCIEHPELSLELAETKLEIELAKKQLASSQY